MAVRQPPGDPVRRDAAVIAPDDLRLCIDAERGAMRKKARAVLVAEFKQPVPDLLVAFRQATTPTVDAFRDRLPRGAVTQTCRSVGKMDRVDRRLQTAFAAVTVKAGQDERMEHSDIGRLRALREGVL